MTKLVAITPLTKDAFAPFGDVIDCSGAPDKIINQGLCGRFHNRAQIDVTDGKTGISLFNAEPRNLPLVLDMVERHPKGSQAFLPMSEHPFLVIVALDENGSPGTPKAFKTAPGQGVNLRKNTWHGVLTPLHAPGLFAVIDRIADDENLEEFWFEAPYTVA